MAGHSKWANIKHKKARADAQKGKLFTKLGKQLINAARQGGADPETNLALRLAMDKARAANMPGENIERAIARGSGDLEGVSYERVIYEGYGPGGAALLVELLTDNRNRSVAEIRHLLSKHGGSMGEAGCVAWMFERRGLLQLNQEEQPGDADELLLAAADAGADDVREEGDILEVYTSPEELTSVKERLEADGFAVASTQVYMMPQNTVTVEGPEAERLLRLVELLEEHEDVQEVYANFDIPDEVMAGFQ